MECTRGYRSFLNMLRDPVDDYIEHKDEIGEILKPFTTVPQVQVSPINQEIYISVQIGKTKTNIMQELLKYVKAAKFIAQMKIFCMN